MTKHVKRPIGASIRHSANRWGHKKSKPLIKMYTVYSKKTKDSLMTPCQKIFLLLCLSTPMGLKSMISYKLASTADRKKVLILGDHHSIPDENIRGYFRLFVQEFLGLPLRRPIPFIVELDKSHDDDDLLASESISIVLALDTQQQKLQRQVFAFIYFEARGAESSFINGLHADVGDCLASQAPASRIAKHYLKDSYHDEVEAYDETTWHEIEKKIKRKTWVKAGCTTKKYRASLQKNLEQIEGLLKKFAHSPEVTTLLITLIDQYKAGQAKLIELLQGDEVSFAYSEHFLNKTLEKRLIFYDLFDELIEATDFVFADCMFFDKVVDTLATEPCVALLVGNKHTRNLAKLLTAYGCDIRASDTVEKYSYPLLENFEIEEYPHAEVLGKSYGKLLNDLIHNVLPHFLESAIALPGTCWSCSEKPEKLMTCSQCRKAFYCSAECQKKDWPLHKKCCKKGPHLKITQ